MFFIFHVIKKTHDFLTAPRGSTQMYHRGGSGGLPLGDFLYIYFFFGKNCCVDFNAIWITFFTILKQFETTDFLRFESQLKQLHCTVFRFSTISFIRENTI